MNALGILHGLRSKFSVISKNLISSYSSKTMFFCNTISIKAQKFYGCLKVNSDKPIFYLYFVRCPLLSLLPFHVFGLHQHCLSSPLHSLVCCPLLLGESLSTTISMFYLYLVCCPLFFLLPFLLPVISLLGESVSTTSSMWRRNSARFSANKTYEWRVNASKVETKPTTHCLLLHCRPLSLALPCLMLHCLVPYCLALCCIDLFPLSLPCLVSCWFAAAHFALHGDLNPLNPKIPTTIWFLHADLNPQLSCSACVQLLFVRQSLKKIVKNFG